MHKFEFVDLGDLFPLANSYPKPKVLNSRQVTPFKTIFGLIFLIIFLFFIFLLFDIQVQFTIQADVIGAMKDYINCTNIPTVHGPRNIVKFEITDGRYLNSFVIKNSFSFMILEHYVFSLTSVVFFNKTGTRLR